MKDFIYKTKGVCSRQIRFSIEQGIVSKVQFESGCNGNSQGLSRLVEGMTVGEVINRLQGIKCDRKGTSCPDQLAQALASVSND